MSTVGIVSAQLTMQHSHLNASQGGVLNAYSRFGAYRAAVAGATISLANANEKIRTGPGYALLKETTIADVTDGFQAGVFSIQFELKTGTNPNQVNAKVYINDIVKSGILSDVTGVYANKIYTFTGTLYKGDRVQVYADDPASVGAYIRNFNIKFGWAIPYFGDGTTRTLTTALTLADSDNPFTIVVTDP